MNYIYTGFKWRPMTPSEIEIMDATRVRPYRLEEPESGDIYEGMSIAAEKELDANLRYYHPEKFTHEYLGKWVPGGFETE